MRNCNPIRWPRKFIDGIKNADLVIVPRERCTPSLASILHGLLQAHRCNLSAAGTLLRARVHYTILH